MLAVVSERDLLQALLALRKDWATPAEVAAGLHVLSSGKVLGISLAELLQNRGMIEAGRKEALEQEAAAQLAGGSFDPEQVRVALRLALPGADETPGMQGPATLPENAASGRTLDSQATQASILEPVPLSGVRYRRLRPHARGGLGQVYVAADQELGREVALKEMLDQHADNPQSRARFILEAEITGGLEHPGVVPVYGLGNYPDGRPFYAMRFIRGESLADAIARFHEGGGLTGRNVGTKNLELRQLLTRFVDVCDVLAYAHNRGVIHRDLKPANIMLGKYGETLVVDWGLAKTREGADEPGTAATVETGSAHDTAALPEPRLKPASAGSSLETVPGSAIGTPAYMSPEQAAGRMDLLGPASDIYSLGATLYHLLVGRPPLEGPDLPTILRKVEKGDFPSPRQVAGKVPRALEAVCLKAMALDPAQRYRTTRDLAGDIERWLADEPVSACPEPIGARVWRWLDRHRTLMVGLGAAILVAVVVQGAATVLLQRANTDLAEANAEETKAKAEAQESEKKAHRLMLRAVEEQAIAVAARLELERETRQRQRELTRAEWFLYAANLGQSQRAWDEGNLDVARAMLDQCRWDFRGWEHDFLWTLFTSNQTSLPAHRAPVTSVACAAGGKMATADARGVIHLHDPRLPGPGLRLVGPASAVLSLVFSPDGALLAAGHEKGEVRLWDPLRGQEIARPEGHAAPVVALDFDLEGKRLLSADRSGKMMVREVKDPAQARALTALGSELLTASIPKGTATVTAVGKDMRILVQDLQGKVLRQRAEGKIATLSANVSPDGQRIALNLVGSTALLLDLAGNGETTTLQGRTDRLRCQAFSPDGKHIMGAGEDNVLHLWDVHGGEEVRYYLGMADDVLCLAYTPDGKSLVTGSRDGSVTIWDVSTSQDPLNLLEHEEVAYGLAFSPDGKLLATAEGDGKVRLWNAAGAAPLLSCAGHKGKVLGIAWTPEGQRLASAGADGSVRIWDAAGGKEIFLLEGHQGQVSGVAFGPEGRRLVSAGYDGRVVRWNARKGEKEKVMTGHDGPILALALSPDGQRVATGGQDRSIRLWDLETGEQLAELRDHTERVTAVAFSPDGTKLVSAGADFNLCLWDVVEKKLLHSLRGHTAEVLCVGFSPDGRRIASGSAARIVKMWDPESGQETFNFNSPGGAVQTLAFSPDGKMLAAGGKQVHLWHALRRKDLLPLLKPREIAVRAEFSPEGDFFATRSKDNRLILWNARTGKDLFILTGHEEEILGFAFDPTGKELASLGSEGFLSFWSTAEGKEIAEIRGSGKPSAVAFDRRGSTIVVGSGDGSLSLIDWKLRKLKAELPGAAEAITAVAWSAWAGDGTYRMAVATASGGVHLRSPQDEGAGRRLLGPGSPVRQLAFSSNGVYLAGVGDDRFLKIWRTEKGILLHTLPGSEQPFRAVAFHPSGRWLASGTADGRVFLWEAATGKKLQVLHPFPDEVAGLAFSPDGRRLFIGSPTAPALFWVLPRLE